MYLTKDERQPAAEFISGGLWQAMKRALQARMPGYSDAGDTAETAAHRAFERKGYEKCLSDMEVLSREASPEEEVIMPPSLLDPRD